MKFRRNEGGNRQVHGTLKSGGRGIEETFIEEQREPYRVSDL